MLDPPPTALALAFADGKLDEAGAMIDAIANIDERQALCREAADLMSAGFRSEFETWLQAARALRYYIGDTISMRALSNGVVNRTGLRPAGETTMIATLCHLKPGHRSVMDDYQKAEVFWANFFAKHAGDTEQQLADALEQCGFTGKFRDYPWAKEIMPLTALLHLYDEIDGFGDNEELARRTVRAFQKAMLSGEVRNAHTKAAANAFGLESELSPKYVMG